MVKFYTVGALAIFTVALVFVFLANASEPVTPFGLAFWTIVGVVLAVALHGFLVWLADRWTP